METLQLPTITVFDRECFVQFGLYQNKTLAITLINKESSEPFMVCTVNWESNWAGVGKYAVRFRPPIVVIKNYAENEGIFAALTKAKVINVNGPYMERTNGTVQISKLTTYWWRIAKKQLEVNNEQ